jgi:serine/threonine protein kinase, bacterial
MKFTHRVVCLITMATVGLVPVAAAPAVSAASVRGTHGINGCIKVTATIPVGSNASGVAADQRTNTVFVANSGSNTVSVIFGRTNTVPATVSVGDTPTGVAANPKTSTVYVTNKTDGTVSVLGACPA